MSKKIIAPPLLTRRPWPKEGINEKEEMRTTPKGRGEEKEIY